MSKEEVKSNLFSDRRTPRFLTSNLGRIPEANESRTSEFHSDTEDVPEDLSLRKEAQAAAEPQVGSLGPTDRGIVGSSLLRHNTSSMISSTISLNESIASVASFLQKKPQYDVQEYMSTLPQEFDTEKVKWEKGDKCSLCFENLKFVLIDRKHHCRKCGRLVCKYCSRNKRRLSLKDTKFYRICDYCETRLANKLFEDAYLEMIRAKQQNIKFLETKIELRKNKIEEMHKDIIQNKKKKQDMEEHYAQRKANLKDRIKQRQRELNQLRERGKMLNEALEGDQKMIDEIRQEVKKLQTSIEIYCGKIDQINSSISGFQAEQAEKELRLNQLRRDIEKYDPPPQSP